MSVYDMIGRIESGMSAVEATSLDSLGNEVETMAEDLIFFHGPDNHQPFNGSEELGDYVIDRIYAIALDKLYLKNEKLSAYYDRVVGAMSEDDARALKSLCITKVYRMYSHYCTKIEQLDSELK